MSRGVLDDAAAEAEADDEIFQIRRRHQHHRLADAVVGDRQRDFLGQRGAGRFGASFRRRRLL